MYFVEKTKGLNFFKHFDFTLLTEILLLSLAGLFILFSALKYDNSEKRLIVQAVALILGIIIAFIISAIDYKDFKILGWLFYFISLILLVYVIKKGVGLEQMGANSWIVIPVIGSFQPSELSKITFIIVIAVLLEKLKESQEYKFKDILKIFVIAAMPIGLVILQPDFGTAMVFIFILVVMLFAFGIKYKYLFAAFIASIPASAFTWFFLLNEKRKERILTFLSPGSDPQGAGYQVIRAIRTIGSGQMFGKGWLQGPQTLRGTVPERATDMIFTVVCEQFGFIGAVLLMILICAILMHCLYVARNSRDLFGSYVVVGLTAMLGFHFFFNIGVCIGIFPVSGIPLPFISSGGSATITNFISIGIILSVSMRRKRAIFNNSQ